MKKNDKWLIADAGKQMQLMKAASDIIDEGRTILCPLCKSEDLPFYYHEFSTSPRRSGTIWVWCSLERNGEHISRIQLPDEFIYPDPFSQYTLEEFENLEKSDFFDRLNSLWNDRKLSYNFFLEGFSQRIATFFISPDFLV